MQIFLLWLFKDDAGNASAYKGYITFYFKNFLCPIGLDQLLGLKMFGITIFMMAAEWEKDSIT